jgi:type IV pilus assembly protein PilC
MATFIWKGKNRFGEEVGGERTAKNMDELQHTLQREQIVLQKVKKKPTEINLEFLERKKVSVKELAIYSRQLSVLIDAELPLIQGLNILAEQTKNKYFKKVVIGVKEQVEAGSSLNQAKRKYPGVFNDLYCNLIASGEKSGSLDVMLQRLAEYLENTVRLRSQIKQAMTYPLAILGFSVLVTIFMMWKIVPIFANIFIELGAKLPFLTAAIMGMSKFVEGNILFIFMGIIGTIVGLKFFKKSKVGGQILDRISLKLPLFGGLMSKVGLSRMTRTLSTLLSGGVPMMESLKVTSTTTGNSVVENKIMKARDLVSQGQSLTDAFKEVKHFPFMMIQMVGVGEATGTLDAMLAKLAKFYDDDVEASVGAMMSILEPVMLFGVGGMVGTIVISMYLPIFELLNTLG